MQVPITSAMEPACCITLTELTRSRGFASSPFCGGLGMRFFEFDRQLTGAKHVSRNHLQLRHIGHMTDTGNNIARATGTGVYRYHN